MALFLRDLPERFAEMNRLADVATDILYSEGQFIHAMPYRADAYNEITPLMHEIRADGIDLRSPRAPRTRSVRDLITVICQSRRPHALVECHSGIERAGATGYDNHRQNAELHEPATLASLVRA